jgi:hypothetical protein
VFCPFVSFDARIENVAPSADKSSVRCHCPRFVCAKPQFHARNSHSEFQKKVNEKRLTDLSRICLVDRFGNTDAADDHSTTEASTTSPYVARTQRLNSASSSAVQGAFFLSRLCLRPCCATTGMGKPIMLDIMMYHGGQQRRFTTNEIKR